MPDTVPPRPVLSLDCRSTLHDVRAVLERCDAFLRRCAIPDDWVEDLNIILAEILSNIARHGYGHGRGHIRLLVEPGARELRCEVTDWGAAFDPCVLGTTAPDPRTLAEGGYGWFMIRSLARALRYRRMDGRNVLTFWVPVGSCMNQPAPAPTA